MRIFCPLQIDFHQDGLLWGLRRLECEVLTLNGWPISRAELTRGLEEFQPDLLFSYGWWWGHLRPEDIQWAKEKYRLPHVYWASDDPTHHLWISLPMAQTADLVFTTAEELVPVYRTQRKKSTYLQFGCNPELHRRVAPPPEAEHHDVVLLANNYSGFDHLRASHRLQCMETIIRPLIEARADLKVYGWGWDDEKQPFHLPPRFTGPVVPYRRQAEIYATAKIVLGLQTECHWPTQTSCRLFEVLGCRAFHLAPATRATLRLFVPGKHLVVSGSPGETLSLVQYYLEHEEERARIAACGQLEVYAKHTYLHRAGEFLAVVNAEL
ncbi:MAG: glycosyltransferase [Firmicutes bacterium]|nr:glycosyltransferase [Bacillota bacterium]